MRMIKSSALVLISLLGAFSASAGTVVYSSADQKCSLELQISDSGSLVGATMKGIGSHSGLDSGDDSNVAQSITFSSEDDAKQGFVDKVVANPAIVNGLFRQYEILKLVQPSIAAQSGFVVGLLTDSIGISAKESIASLPSVLTDLSMTETIRGAVITLESTSISCSQLSKQ